MWTAVYQCNVVYIKRALECCHLIQLVQNHACVGIALDVDFNSYTILLIAEVLDVGNAVDFLLFSKFVNRAHQISLDNIIRYFGDDNYFVVVDSFDFSFGADYNSATSSLECFFHTGITVNGSSGWEIWGLDIVHQLRNSYFGIIQICYASVD